MKISHIFGVILLVCLSACKERVLNDPYPHRSATANIYYGSFNERPKTLDPARSYSANENIFIAQIYEPPLQYAYLKRPYTLEPLAATTMPEVHYFDAQGRELSGDPPSDQIAQTVYKITIKPHQYYHPHPAFAIDKQGHYRYHHLSADEILMKNNLADFAETQTREVMAEDFVYEIKRLASPQIQSPIYGLMSHYIVGMEKFNATITQELAKVPETERDKHYIDLRQFNLTGVKVTGSYSYSITINGKYPQFLYWLAMSFFAPMPWEADNFYHQPEMSEHNFSLDWYPVGSGPYFMSVNNPNQMIVLERNQYFHGENYPLSGEPGDKEKGYLTHSGESLPFINQFVFTLETESIPRWTKFLQGYYDASGISNDSFEQAIRIDPQGQADLTEEIAEKGIRLGKTTDMSTYFLGFNMLDPLVGGKSLQARYLRQAISIALNQEDYIALFLNGRGIVAQSPLPPGIFGAAEGTHGIDDVVYRVENGQVVRRSIAEAQALLAKAGYVNGRDPQTGEPLVLNFDTVAGHGGEDKARLDWFRKQFSALGIQLQIRSTTYSRFQEKARIGDVQMFDMGWSADYPDPENFLFLLYGPNGKVKYGGENTANYSNAEFDKLFVIMKNMANSPERAAVIANMLKIIDTDAPLIYEYHPLVFTLMQSWDGHHKPNAMANNTLKYYSVNPIKRAELRLAWNKPVWWPIVTLLIILFLVMLPVIRFYYYKEYYNTRRRYDV